MSGLFFQNDESGYDESFAESGGGMSTTEELQDKLSTKLALRRLLYRMERYEDLTILQEDNDNNLHRQSWQSLLVRAQLCQTLWQKVAVENVDEGSDPRLRKEYMELSQRVDSACKKAQLLADQAREQEVKEGTEQDLVGKLFFSHPIVSDDESETVPGRGGDEALSNEDRESSEGDDYYDEFEDDESATEHPSRQHNTSRTAEPTPNLQDLQQAQREQIEEAIAMMAKQMKESTQGIRKTLQKQNANTLNELENVAEQNMEDVSKVASNVKEHVVANQRSSWATWTTMILIVGVFAFTLVTIFTIPKHPDANLGRILSGDNENGPYARLLQKTIHTVQSVFGKDGATKDTMTTDEEHLEEDNWDDYEIPQDKVASDAQERLNQLVRDMQSGNRKTKQEKQQEEELLQQEKEKLQRDEQLRKLQEELQEKERLRQEAKRQQEETLRKQKLEEEKRQQEERIRKQNLEAEKRQREAQERREKIRQKKLEEQERLKQQRLEEEEKLKLQNLEQERQEIAEEDDQNPRGVEPEEEIEPANENTSADDILASLKSMQQEPMANNDDFESENKQEDETIEAFKPPQLDREGVAAKMVSPRDFRLAAASNDYETLQRYLDMAPQHINRQDKHGWTALHMAVHGQHERIVTLLLDQTHDQKDMADLNIDPFVESYEEKRTALDLALEQFGVEHPITEAFFSSGWYERSDYEDWGNEEARLRKQKLLEHEARIAKEKEAIDAKEARYAAAAEEERRIKKDKLDQLFGTPIEEEDDDIDEDTIQERRDRLDALLDEL